MRVDIPTRGFGKTEALIEELVRRVISDPNTRIILPGPPSAQNERIIREVNRRAALLNAAKERKGAATALPTADPLEVESVLR